MGEQPWAGLRAPHTRAWEWTAHTVWRLRVSLAALLLSASTLIAKSAAPEASGTWGEFQ